MIKTNQFYTVKIVSHLYRHVAENKRYTMKKLILSIFIIGGFAAVSNAQKTQDDQSSKMMFGLKAGTNYSNVYDSKSESFNADGKFGLAAGAFVIIPIGKYIGIQPEVLFSQKGFKATGSLLGSPYSFTRTTSYIDVPLLLSIKPVESFTILVGPQYSYLLKQKDNFVTSATSVAQQKEFDNDNIRKNTLCITGGFDVNLKQIVLSGRAGWDVQNNNGDGTSSTPRYKNVWYQATVGFRF